MRLKANWSRDPDTGQWREIPETLKRNDFDSVLQTQDSFRLWQNCLSGSLWTDITTVPTEKDGLRKYDDIYPVLGVERPGSPYFLQSPELPYVSPPIPSVLPSTPVPVTSEEDIRVMNNLKGEGGLTLRNYFSPEELRQEKYANLTFVDVATTGRIPDLISLPDQLTIDGVRIKEGQRVLVKEQTTLVTLLSIVDPDTIFRGKYEFESEPVSGEFRYRVWTPDNGVYVYTGGVLVRTEHDKDSLILVKSGTENKDRTFGPDRMLNGLYPDGTSTLSAWSSSVLTGDPVSFSVSVPAMLRHRTDYNNLYELVLRDTLWHGPRTANVIRGSLSYVVGVPERQVTVGEFGSILFLQSGTVNIIRNPFKEYLLSVALAGDNYWTCGKKGTLLRVNVGDHKVDRVVLPGQKPEEDSVLSLNSISFLDDFKGVIVGDNGGIWVTENGGSQWVRLSFPSLGDVNYQNVHFLSTGRFVATGDNGTFVLFNRTVQGWSGIKKRISTMDNGVSDELTLVDDIMTTEPFTTPSGELIIAFGTSRGETFLFDPDGFLGITVSEFIRLEFVLQDAITGMSYGDVSTGLYISTLAGLWNIDPLSVVPVGLVSNRATVTATQVSVQTGIYGIGTNPVPSPTSLSIVGLPSIWKQIDLSTTNMTDTDPSFLQRLKPGLLFLDYDVASKVYWHDDLGQYRLPSRLNVPESFLFPLSLDRSSLEFIPPLSTITGNIERTWFDYYADGKKTFRYYSSLDQSDVIEPSWKFTAWEAGTASYSYLPVDLTTDLVDVTPLMPNMTPVTSERGTSRFRSGATPITLPTSGHDLYFYDYLGVWKNTVPPPVSRLSPPSQGTQEGDLLKITCDVFDGVFMVNRVVGPTGSSGRDYYCYFYTDFEQSVTNDLGNLTGQVTVRNLNKYPSGIMNAPDVFVDNFNDHWISYAYMAERVSEEFPVGGPVTDSILFTGVKTDKSAYYSIQSRVDITDLNNVNYVEDVYYPSGFLNFGNTAEYGLLSYLTFIDPVEYTPSREFLSLPRFAGIPAGIGTGNILISFTETDRLWLGSDLKSIWDTIPLWVFVDVSLDSTLSERLLVTEKYVDEDYPDTPYVIRFQSPLVSSDPGSSSGSGNIPFYPTISIVDIGCRRTLSEMDDDLRYLNSIHRPDWKQGKSYDTVNIDLNTVVGTWDNYESGHGRKYPTDSYMRTLVLDRRLMEDMSAIIHTDDKGLLNARVMPLDEISERNFTLISINNQGGFYRFDLPPGDEHNLVTGDTVLLYGPGSLSYPTGLLGVHVVTSVPGPNTIITDVTFGGLLTPGQAEELRMKNVTFDPFFNYSPVDYVQIDPYTGDSTISVYLGPENTEVTVGNRRDLVKVNPEKLRYRLRDGLSMRTLSQRFPWFLEADVKNALIGVGSDGGLLWYRGTWECGRWFSGTWLSGRWLSGDWFSGIWTAKNTDDPDEVSVSGPVTFTDRSRWYSGRWFSGTWENGIWYSGRWYSGEWKTGIWKTGIWNGGRWYNGEFRSGIWVTGIWDLGTFSTMEGPSFWLDGEFNGGDFVAGEWFTGTFRQVNDRVSRFGVNPSRSRMAIWRNGRFLSGQFHSVANLVDGRPVVSDDHRYSLWMTGKFIGGDFYGGVVRNIEFGAATWHGGISEEVIITDMNVTDGVITVQGELPWRNGDFFNIVDREPLVPSPFNVYGSLSVPVRYRVLNAVYDVTNDETEVLVFPVLSGFSGPSGDPQGELAVVSTFEGSRWLSGIWFNGVFKKGYFYGGTWFDGYFDGDWG